MVNLRNLLGAILAFAPFGAMAVDKAVFAHFIIGVSAGMTIDDWNSNIASAQAAGIDGFALDISPNDDYTDTQLGLAYQAAEAAGFKMFLSIDMNYDWTPDVVATFINNYKTSGAQYTVDSKPFVSTFEGGDWADNWTTVKASTGDIFFMPEWSGIGIDGIMSHADIIDGAFNWASWVETPSEGKITNDQDLQWMSSLGDKPYMMGVSPWFYTNIAQYKKNALWGSDTLWYDRWELVLDTNPAMVEILTWNDWGESHYIADTIYEPGVPADATVYVDGSQHGAWKFVLPYYISAFKAGGRPASVGANQGAVFWYRQTPKGACSDGGTQCAGTNIFAASGVSATQCVEDNVYVMTLLDQASTVTVQIGGVGQDFQVEAGAKLVQLPFGSSTGDVTVAINGNTATGPVPISATCAGAAVNFNPVVEKLQL